MLKVKSQKQPIDYVVGLLRISLGVVFTWAFVDKLAGLGFTTCKGEGMLCQSSWLAGGSPTEGFLLHATQGPFADFFNGLAGNVAIDWMFMLGLALVGASLLLGMGIYLGVLGGSLMLLLMYLAVLPPENNPFMDDHLIYILALLVVALENNKQRLGFGRKWQATSLARKHKWLK